MKHFLLKPISMGLLLAAGHACFGAANAAESEASSLPEEWTAVSDEHLDQLRGGFDINPGLTVSFGFVRTLMINGVLATKTSFDLPDLAHITAEQAQAVSAAIAQSNIVQNGTGNTVSADLGSQFPASTVIQNSLNDQKIQNLTIIDAGVNSFGLIKAIHTQATLKDALLGAVGVR